METEVPGVTRDRDEKKRRLHEHFYERLEVMKRRRVKEQIDS